MSRGERVGRPLVFGMSPQWASAGADEPSFKLLPMIANVTRSRIESSGVSALLHSVAQRNDRVTHLNICR